MEPSTDMAMHTDARIAAAAERHGVRLTSMHWPSILLLAVGLLVGCTSSDEIPFEDVTLECTSAHEEMIYIYFRVPDGVDCEGVRIEQSGTTRTLTFVRSSDDASPNVDSRAVLSDDLPWVGCLRVEVPLPEGLRRDGGDLTLAYKGANAAGGRWSFPKR